MAAKNVSLQKHWTWFFGLGIFLLLFGLVMIVLPVVGSFAIDLFIGVVLLIAGVLQVVMAFNFRNWKGFLIKLLTGILYGGAGLLLLVYPLSGVITLTLFLAAFLLIEGVLEIAFAYKLKPESHWNWVLFDGVIGILLGVLIIANWPSDSLWVLGLLFGINLVFSGVTSLVLSLSAREK